MCWSNFIRNINPIILIVGSITGAIVEISALIFGIFTVVPVYPFLAKYSNIGILSLVLSIFCIPAAVGFIIGLGLCYLLYLPYICCTCICCDWIYFRFRENEF